MSPKLFRRARLPLPREVKAAVGPDAGRVVAHLRMLPGDESPWLVVAAHELVVVGSAASEDQPEEDLRQSASRPPSVLLRRPWHLVAAAAYDDEHDLLTVTWADGAPTSQWTVPADRDVLQALRERVQASVVLAEELVLPGRRRARVCVRQDLATGALLDQVVIDGGGALGGAQASALVERTLAALHEQVGR